MLVGDNASGKTSVLEALRFQSALDDSNPVGVLRGEWQPADLVRRGAPEPMVLESSGARNEQEWQTTLELRLTPEGPDDRQRSWNMTIQGKLGEQSLEGNARGQDGSGSANWPPSMLRSTMGSVVFYTLRPGQIAAPGYSERPDARVAADGTNTAVVLAAMKLADDEAFDRIEETLCQLVPAVQRIRIRRARVPEGPEGFSVMGNQLYFDFRGAPDVPAHAASHGTLLVLALLTILHDTNRPDLILLDELEQSLHPRAQMEVVRTIKKLLDQTKDLQIVATTHSPYMLDELDPSEIHGFALRDDGTVATRLLSEHPEAEKMKGTLTAGQLWSLDPERYWVLRE